MFKFMENFYAYAPSGTTLASANNNFNTQWITHGSGSIVISDGFEVGTRALTLSRAATNYGRVERRLETDQDTIIIGWAFQATARETNFVLGTASQPTLIELEWPKGFKIGAVEGTATILLNKKYFVELKYTKSTGAVDLRVNGYPYLTTTVATVTEDLFQAYFGYSTAGLPSDYKMSHVYFIDSAPGKYTDFLGPHIVQSRVIDEAIGAGWSPEPDTMSRVEIVSAIPPVAGRYTESDIVGTKDFYKSSTAIDPDLVVNAVAVTSLLAKTDIDDQYVALAVSDGTTDKLGTDIEVPLQPSYFQTVFEQDVDDTDWTVATAEAVEFGPVIQPRPQP